ncbi:hypothetical protein BD779DRAFT_507036 [Infundibulicybe gibba]|nr:hypothetical protein BD779DRAFT_507036 [Infundibulicybe gibba]
MIALRTTLVAFLCATVAIAGTIPELAASSKPADGPGLGELCLTIVGTAATTSYAVLLYSQRTPERVSRSAMEQWWAPRSRPATINHSYLRARDIRQPARLLHGVVDIR